MTRVAILLAVLAVSFRVLLVLIPSSTTRLEMDVDSSVASFSQVFVADRASDFVEQESVKVPLTTGSQHLSFPLGPVVGMAGDQMRWDPAADTGMFVVRDVRITNMLTDAPILLSQIKPSLFITDFRVDGDSLIVGTGSRDGQLLIEARTASAVAQQQWLNVFLSIAMAGTVLLAARPLVRAIRRGWPAQRRGQTLSEAFNPRDNALNFIRLVLACLVIASHTNYITGRPSQSSLGFIGEGLTVDAFFGLSGFLMARSLLRMPNAARYTWHRVTRLLPAFWFALVAVAFVFAPVSLLLGGRGLGSLLDGSDGPVSYVWRNATMWVIQNGVSGTPVEVPISGVWNAPTWTMGWTFSCDLLLALVATLGLLKRPRAMALLAWVAWLSLAVMVLDREPLPVEYPSAWYAPARLILLFLIGVVFQLGAAWVPMRWQGAALAGVFVVASVHFWGTDYRVFAAAPLVYLVLWLSCRLPVRVGSKRDLSYGLYLLGWPSQQVLASVAPISLTGWAFTGASVLVALPWAYVCWTFVESRAMRLRDWTPWWLQRPRLTLPTAVAAAVSALLLLAYLSVWWAWVKGTPGI